jgi:succinate dehydrogenase hydrophobic anchor subunit
MGWNRQNITDWMAMAGAVSALVLVVLVVGF